MENLINSSNKDIAILVSSCDKFSDVWEVFFPLFWKLWPDCPFNIYLVTNFKSFEHEKVTVIKVGEEKSWADDVKMALSKVEAKYFLFFFEDVLISDKVDTERVLSLCKTMAELNASKIVLRRTPGPYKEVDGHPELLEVVPYAPYRAGLAVAIWNKEILNRLLKLGETPWDMEIKGSVRSNDIPRFYVTKEMSLPIHNGLEKGKWMRYNLPLLERENIKLPEGHPLMSIFEHIKLYYIQNYFGYLKTFMCILFYYSYNLLISLIQTLRLISPNGKIKKIVLSIDKNYCSSVKKHFLKEA